MLAALSPVPWSLVLLGLVLLLAVGYALLVAVAAGLALWDWLDASRAREAACLALAAVTLTAGCAVVDGPGDEPWRQWLQSQDARDGHADWVRKMKRSQL